MSRLQAMSYAAEFLRGWPNEGALETSIYPAKSGETLSAGDLVVLDSNNELEATGTDLANAGIVVRGNADDKSVVAANGNCIVLWGGYIVRTQKVTMTGLAPMTPVVATAGVFVDAVLNAPMGTVLEVIPAAGGEPASAVIVVR